MDELLTKVMSKIYSFPSRFLFAQFRIQEQSFFNDHPWSFWYHLGEEVRPKTVADFGNELALEAASVAFGAEAKRACLYNNGRFARSNMKTAGIREFGKDRWDLAITAPEFSKYFDFIWKEMNLGGLLCVIDGESDLKQFAKTKNREPVFCQLRYMVGLLQK